MADDFFANDNPGELHGKLDAILRDGNASGDVRATATQILAFVAYVDTHDFQTDDNGYVTSVLKPDAPAPGTVASDREAQQDAEIARLQSELDAANAAPNTGQVTVDPTAQTNPDSEAVPAEVPPVPPAAPSDAPAGEVPAAPPDGTAPATAPADTAAPGEGA